MRSLSRAITQRGTAAPAIPNMFTSLHERGVSIRSGEVSMIAGMPAAGKSMLALALAVRAHVPTIYLSADSHLHTQAMRLLAMVTNTEQSVIEPAMEDKEWASETLAAHDYIRWSFSSAPSARDIEEEVEAHITLMGQPPELFIVDNLTDCLVDGDEFGGMRSFMKDLKFYAREYGMAVLVLHHTSEAWNLGPGQCPPRSSLQGKVAQTPALVMTVTDEGGYLGVCPVKNRYGRSSPNGDMPTWFQYDPASCQVTEIPGQETVSV
jgi:hypothetical protein